MKNDTGATSTPLLRAAWQSRRAALVVGAAVLVAILAYALTRQPYVATARVTVGHIVQSSTTGPAAFVLIEPTDIVERRLAEDTLPKMKLGSSCSAQARAIYRGGPIVLTCRAGDKDAARQRVMTIAEHLIAEHRERFDSLRLLLHQRIDNAKQRLARIKDMEQRLNDMSSAKTRGRAEAQKEPESTFQGFMMARELLSVQESAEGIHETVELNTSARKLDRMTKLDPDGVTVVERPLTPLMLAVALVISLAFGAFVALVLAAVATLRQAGYADDSNS